jgi:hypothetical protein
MSDIVREVSREELLAERERLLASIAMTREELAAMAELGGLSGTQFWVYEDIRCVEFLLGDDVAAD